MADLSFTPAETLAAAIRRRDLSPRELMEHTLRRIEALNPRFNAFVALDAERALAEADAQTERLARGEDLGPLGGLPLGVKDLENAAGFVTSFGSRAFRENRVQHDDYHVARLKRAGAIVLGKTNTPEFGHIPFTDNDLFGPTRNPWNPERTPGGSSGGAAAALVSGMVALATASDGGGSVRIPAAYCGLYGIKPSFGRVASGPTSILGWLDIGVQGALTRTVRDAALYLDQIVGPHAADPNSLPHPGFSYLEALETPLRPLRIGFNRTLGVTRVQRDVMREVEAAAQVFQDLGHRVEEDTSTIPETVGYWVRLSAFQSLMTLGDVYSTRRDELSSRYAGLLDDALSVQVTDFREFYTLRAQLMQWTADLFERYDLLLTPTLPTEAFGAAGPIPMELEVEPFQPVAFTYPFNFTGHPAASVRAGFTDGGLPCGLQIVGPRHRDDLVLQASYAYEQARPWNDRWPAL